MLPLIKIIKIKGVSQYVSDQSCSVLNATPKWPFKCRNLEIGSIQRVIAGANEVNIYFPLFEFFLPYDLLDTKNYFLLPENVTVFRKKWQFTLMTKKQNTDK